MRTSEIISNAKQRCPNWSRMSLLNFLNMLEQTLIGSNVVDRRIVDLTTGRDPILVTISGVLSYSIDPTTIPNISQSAYLVEFLYVGYDGRVSDVYGYDGYDNTYPSDDICRVPVTTVSGIYNTPAKVIFDHDPGQGRRYYVRAFAVPSSITAETIQTMIPERFHMDIVDAIAGLVEQNENGKSDNYTVFKKETLPLIKWNIDKNKDNYRVPKYNTPGF